MDRKSSTFMNRRIVCDGICIFFILNFLVTPCQMRLELYILENIGNFTPKRLISKGSRGHTLIINQRQNL